MVRVTLKSEKYDRIEFEFADCEVAGKFLDVAMATAVGNVKAEIETVEPAEKPQEESRFIVPEGMTEVPAEEMTDEETFSNLF